MENLGDLGKIIINFREKMHISQRKLAKIIGVNFVTIQRIEHGKDYRKGTEILILQKLKELEKKEG